MTLRATTTAVAEGIFRAWGGLVLLSIGIHLHPYEYLAGLVLALAGASISTSIHAQLKPDANRQHMLLTAVVAIFFSHLSAVWIGEAQDMSPSVVMGFVGFGSRWIAISLVKAFYIFESSAPQRMVDWIFSFIDWVSSSRKKGGDDK